MQEAPLVKEQEKNSPFIYLRYSFMTGKRIT